MSRRLPVIAAESRPSLSRGARMALSYAALFVFTAFALYPISRIITIALRPGDQLLSSSLAFISRGATLALSIHQMLEPLLAPQTQTEEADSIHHATNGT